VRSYTEWIAIDVNDIVPVSREKHVELGLAGVQGNIKAVLNLSRLDKVFNVVEEST